MENKQTFNQETESTKKTETAVQEFQYTLYPDAGEFDTTLLSPPVRLPEESKYTFSIPPSSHGKPSSAPVISPAAPPPPPSPVHPSTTTEQENRQIRRPFSFSRMLLRCFFIVMIVFSILVYADLLLTRTDAINREVLGKAMIGTVFGGRERVAFLPSPAQTVVPMREDTETPTTDILTPPANETENSAATLRSDDTVIRDLSSSAAGGLGLINETPYTPNLTELAEKSPIIPSLSAISAAYGPNAPVVLILHTHGTEAFSDSSQEGYHTTDRSRNICAVGKALYEVLTESDIPTLHCTELFDAEAFDLSYYNASLYIRKTLEAYPSIRYILDIHRDAIVTADGTGIRPFTLLNDTGYAQLMFVVGTDHGGSGHTTWTDNLSLAARLQFSIHTDYPTLMRDINLRSASFNAQYAPGALLIEAGAAASTLEEAVRSIRVLGEALVKEILQN